MISADLSEHENMKTQQQQKKNIWRSLKVFGSE